MIQLTEFKDEYEITGKTAMVKILNHTAIEKFVEWQKETSKKNGKFKIISVQKIHDGIFVVWEK